MSITLQSIAWKTGLGTSPKFILISLCDHADDDGWGIYPSIEYTALRTSVHERTVQRVLKRFKQIKLLIEVRAATHDFPTEYRLNTAMLRDLARDNKDPWASLKKKRENYRGGTVSPPSEFFGMDVNKLDRRGDKSNKRGDIGSQTGVAPRHPNHKEPLVRTGENQKRNVNNPNLNGRPSDGKPVKTPKPDKQTAQAAHNAIAEIDWNDNQN